MEYTKEELEKSRWEMIAEIDSLKSQLKRARHQSAHMTAVCEELEKEIEELQK